MLRALDIFFIAFHSALILFNLFGWIHPKTRRWNLATLLATAFSWFVLGIWYGWGYCFCTDWHWEVRHQLGYSAMPPSYVAFLIREVTGLALADEVVDAATAVLFFASFAASLWVNLRSASRHGSS